MNNTMFGRFGAVAALGLALGAGGCSCSSDKGAGGSGGFWDGGAGISGAGTGGFGGFSGGSGTGGASGASGASGVGGVSGNCADAQITATNAIPTVWLLLDGSSSMQQRYGNTTRWLALREALVGPNGVLRALDDRINFGMAIYAGQYVNGDPLGSGECPIPGIPIPATTSTGIYENCDDGMDSGMCGDIIGTVAGRNFMQIEQALPADESPGQRTPSGEALNWLYDQLAPGITEPDGERAPIYVLFATDGEPNSCSGGGGGPTFQLSEDAVTRGTSLNITTYVLSLAQGGDTNAQFEEHLQRLANIGAGLSAAASPGATLYSPDDPAQLASDLEQLLTATLDCTISLRGTVDVARACEGSNVQLNGMPLACGGPNGWQIGANGRTLDLVGDACTTFQTAATVQIQATFPCDTIIPD